MTGIDYTGAIPIRVKKEEESVYILLFACGVTRAIHLEIVETMTSGAFISALRRFTSRHSILRVIYSENASTFVSASNILVQLFQHPEVAKELANMRSTWKFIPAHLLDGQRITTLPYHHAADEEWDDPTYGRATGPLILSKAYLRTQNVLRAFWRRWSTVYRTSLRQHHQATKGTTKELIKAGDVVQVHQDGKRSEWKLAVVEQLNRGADDLVRSAEIRTVNGKTNRPINKLYPLEVFASTEELILEESKKPLETETDSSSVPLVPIVAESSSAFEVREPTGFPFVSSIPLPIVDEVSPRSGRLQRRVAQKAVENIKMMAYMETVEEEGE